MDIIIQGISFSPAATSVQSVTIKYRKTADPDVPASYTLVSANVTVQPSGDISPDISITGLDEVAYTVVVLNNCSGRGVSKTYQPSGGGPVYAWVENAYTCEQDAVFTQSAQVTNLSSPGALLYDESTKLVYGVDYDNASGAFFSYDPDNFTTAAQITYYPALLQAGASNFMFGSAVDTASRRLFCCGRDSDGVQVYDIATGVVQVIAWGCNHNVGNTCGDPLVRNGFSRAMMVNAGGTILAFDKYSQSLISINPQTLAFTTRAYADVPSGNRCLSGSPAIARVEDELWVLSSQANNSDAPQKLPNLYRYDLTFTTLLGEVDLTALSAIFDGGAYLRSIYYDKPNGKVYVMDAGANRFIVIDQITHQIVHSRTVNVRQGKTHVALGFTYDPVLDILFLSGSLTNSFSDATMISVAYRVDRTTYQFSNVYADTSVGNLCQIGGRNEFHGTSMGYGGWSGTPGWNTDGKIIKYTK